jgi:alpha-beta hydrolase superfamily lysophospholipase
LSAGDETAPTESASELARRLAGPVELVWWPDSGHLLLNGPEAAAIVARAVNFCQEQVAGDRWPVVCDRWLARDSRHPASDI